MKRVFFAFLAAVFACGANANWEYAGRGGPGGSGADDARFVFAVRAGAAMPQAKMTNDLGLMENHYWDCGGVNTPCDEADLPEGYIGMVDLGLLPVNAKYNTASFAGGASAGVAFGGLRLEIDWMRVAQSNFSASPLFFGSVYMYGDPDLDGNLDGIFEYHDNSVAAARASVSTDIISAMIYYDFGRPSRGRVTPYIGAGFGYAASTAVLTLVDTWGDLAANMTLDGVGTALPDGAIEFYTSETITTNFAATAAAGFAFGIADGVFLDIGGRASYVPRISWTLNNGSENGGDITHSRGIFSAENVIFLSGYAGVRFEF
ncbi:MAG: hypothetical protein LBL46_03385 [Rickettsiales bacterium]|jgi:opacity protein-like surface antigen|nr:hypothetical protein [Rickettsiales bacterium]